eukprot:378248-Prymnesium_polylepis.1
MVRRDRVPHLHRRLGRSQCAWQHHEQVVRLRAYEERAVRVHDRQRQLTCEHVGVWHGGYGTVDMALGVRGRGTRVKQRQAHAFSR